MTMPARGPTRCPGRRAWLAWSHALRRAGSARTPFRGPLAAPAAASAATLRSQGESGSGRCRRLSSGRRGRSDRRERRGGRPWRNRPGGTRVRRPRSRDGRDPGKCQLRNRRERRSRQARAPPPADRIRHGGGDARAGSACETRRSRDRLGEGASIPERTSRCRDQTSESRASRVQAAAARQRHPAAGLCAERCPALQTAP